MQTLAFWMTLGLILNSLGGVKAQETPTDTVAMTAQDSLLMRVANMRWKKKILFADNLLSSGDHLNAILVYQMAQEEKPKDTYTLHQLAEANYAIRYYPEVIRWYENLLAIDSLRYPYARYYLAKSLKYNGDYQKAIEQFERFHKTEFKKIKRKADLERMAEIKSTIADEVEGCRMALSYQLEKPKNIYLKNLGPQVNHPLTDLSPRLLNDSLLLYAALLPDSAFAIDDTTLIRHTRLLLASLHDSIWSNSRLYDVPFNTGDYHIGNASPSPDGKRLYFTRCKETSMASMRCQIYETAFTDTGWSQPVLLGEGINGDFSSSHPMAALDRNGNEVLYYASTSPGGRGGYDLWFTIRDASGKYSAPQNLGFDLNTYADDITPFYDTATHTLYFSSEGRINIGGFDIYSSKQDAQGNWSAPQHLGIPLNSSVDDLYYARGTNKRKGFIVSNRPGGLSPKSPTCCDDIWEFRLPTAYAYVEGWVTDDSLGERIRQGTIYVYDAATDSLIASVPVADDGYFKVKLPGDRQFKLKATSPDFFDAESAVSTIDREDGELIRKDIKMKKKPYRVGFPLGVVYYDFDKSKLRDDARPVLSNVLAIMKNYPIIIEIGGHTDAVGTEEYNQKLSERRAEAVYNYLVREGIAPERLYQKGYGEKKNVAPNRLPNGKDNPEGRQLNRRAEFVVIGELAPASK
ncbi:MAG: cell envelope biogenesis protein OmpA [Chitinophagales bacterium]|nr:MAG: cell envelope biogenesis protein OmpA [Chitinophagales bacterium]